MKLKYYTDDNVEMALEHFSINDMLQSLLDFGLINEITGIYSDDIFDMCNNASLIVAKHLSMYTNDIVICEGVFAMKGNHTWVNVGGIIFDATLAQFIPSAPELAVLLENEHYQELKRYTLEEWLETI